MPSIRIAVTKDVYEEMKYESSGARDLRYELSHDIRVIVAETFGFGMEDTETIWFIPAYWDNMFDFCVDVMFSVTEKFNPDQQKIRKLVDDLLHYLQATRKLPKGITVSVWAVPLPGAVYDWTKRPPIGS